MPFRFHCHSLNTLDVATGGGEGGGGTCQELNISPGKIGLRNKNYF